MLKTNRSRNDLLKQTGLEPLRLMTRLRFATLHCVEVLSFYLGVVFVIVAFVGLVMCLCSIVGLPMYRNHAFLFSAVSILKAPCHLVATSELVFFFFQIEWSHLSFLSREMHHTLEIHHFIFVEATYIFFLFCLRLKYYVEATL